MMHSYVVIVFFSTSSLGDSDNDHFKGVFDTTFSSQKKSFKTRDQSVKSQGDFVVAEQMPKLVMIQLVL